jgi:propionyl-CoA carboxylase beta chain
VSAVPDLVAGVELDERTAPLPSTRHEQLEEWRVLRAEVLSPQDAAAVERQLSRGKLLARERIEQLLDPGSFQELLMMNYTAYVPQLRGKQAFGDGIVAGWGTIDGRRIFVFSQDATVVGGSLGEIGGAKVQRIIDLAIEGSAPVVGILDGGGARIQEGVSSLNAFGGIFFRNTRASGVVPQISLIMGIATGGAVYSPALTDFVFMVAGTAILAITGPKVIKEVTGEDVSLEDLGGAVVHGQRSGVVHFVVPDERTCLDAARRLLSFLPQNYRQRPPSSPPLPARSTNGWDPLDVLPAGDGGSYDVRAILTALVDAADLFEYSAGFAPSIVCGFARLDGHPVGLVANQPQVRSGYLDIDSCEKAARFVRTCDAYNLPVVTLVDCPGFTATAEKDQGPAVRAAAKLVCAWAEATSPKVQVVIGRAHHRAIVPMGVTRDLSDVRLAWPTADLSTGSVVADPAERLRPSLYDAAMQGVIDRVIEPQETRAALIETLAMLAPFERQLAPRKHENLPL